MTPGSFTNAFKGIGGEFELTRVVGAAGSFTYLAGAVGFVAWNMAEGRPFDLTAWCVAFPGGFGAILLAIAGGAGLKDRNVAVAKATEAKTRTDEAAAHAGAGTSPNAVSEAAAETAGAAVDKAEEIKGKGNV